MFHALAQPRIFHRLSKWVLPLCAVISLAALAYGLYLALWVSPPDYQQGDAVRIMYVHVPCAWLGLFIYATAGVAAFIAMVWRHRIAEFYMDAAMPIGAIFTGLCLITGAIWGQPMWGTWWVWDARLTSVLVLFLQYIGYMALRGAFDDDRRGLQAASILLLVGLINLPIIKFSVDWWNTLHQPASISRFDRPALAPAMLTPLLVMAAGLFALYGTMVMLRLEKLLLRARQTAQRLRQG